MTTSNETRRVPPAPTTQRTVDDRPTRIDTAPLEGVLRGTEPMPARRRPLAPTAPMTALLRERLRVPPPAPDNARGTSLVGPSLSYDVYGPGGLLPPAPRPSVRPPRARLRVGLVLFGVVIAAGTAAAVVGASDDDTAAPTPIASSANLTSATLHAPPAASVKARAPTAGSARPR